MDKKEFENCKYKASCKKYNEKNGCPLTDPDAEPFCMKLFRVRNLQDAALLTEKQRAPVDITLDKQKEDAEVFRRLEELEGGIEDFVTNGKNLYMYSPITGNGKAQPDDAKIVTPNGYVTMKDIKVGDELFGEDGEIHHVVKKFDRGTRTTYRVKLSDGSSTRCCKDHLWKVFELGKDDCEVLSLKTILKKLKHNAGAHDLIGIPMSYPLVFPPKVEEGDVSPYTVGTALGITGVAPTAVDLDDYLYGSIDERLELLKGIMDVHGDVCDDADLERLYNVPWAYFLNPLSSGVYDSVKFVIESLGGAVVHACGSITSYHNPDTDAFEYMTEETWSCFFTLPPDMVPFKNAEKTGKVGSLGVSLPERFISSVDTKRREHCYCIATDNPSGLYLTDDCIVTHNTTWALRLMQDYFDKVWYKYDSECSALFINVPRFLLGIKDCIDKKVGDTADYVNYIKAHVMEADLVIWDDIATKSSTPYEKENLLSMIGGRIDAGKANIYTSNMHGKELKEALGDRLYSRVFGASEILEFYSKDRRGLGK